MQSDSEYGIRQAEQFSLQHCHTPGQVLLYAGPGATCELGKSEKRTVAATMTRKAMMTWAAPGTKNAQRHASNSGTLCAMAVVR